jgi:hypothetical protein
MCNAHVNFSDTKKIKWIMGGKTKFYPKLKLVSIMKTQPKFECHLRPHKHNHHKKFSKVNHSLKKLFPHLKLNCNRYHIGNIFNSTCTQANGKCRREDYIQLNLDARVKNIHAKN